MRFAGYGFGKQCFSGSGRAYKKRSFRKFCTDRCVFSRVMQEIHNLLERFFCLVLSRNIAECHAGFFLYVGLCFALSYAHDSAAFVHAAHHPYHDSDKHHNRQNDCQQCVNDRSGRIRRIFVVRNAFLL